MTEPATAPTGPMFPNVKVQLSGADGNAFMIIARTRVALRRAGYKVACDEYRDEAMQGDYDNVIQTTMRYVDVA